MRNAVTRRPRVFHQTTFPFETVWPRRKLWVPFLSLCTSPQAGVVERCGTGTVVVRVNFLVATWKPDALMIVYRPDDFYFSERQTREEGSIIFRSLCFSRPLEHRRRPGTHGVG